MERVREERAGEIDGEREGGERETQREREKNTRL